MVDIDKLIEEYHEKHEVVYELRVIVDDEVLVKHTSGISADDVVGYAWQLDEQVQKAVLEEEEGRLENLAEAQMELNREED